MGLQANVRGGGGGGDGECARGYPAPGERGKGRGVEFWRRYFTGGDVAKNELFVWGSAERSCHC